MIIDSYVFTEDVLTMTVLIGEHGYPSLNRIGADGRRGGRKSKAYHALFKDVVTFGRYAVTDGWRMIEYPCDYYVRRYCMKNVGRDSLNIGHVEANALTAARVWADDRLAVDPHPSWVLDVTGPERVTIIVVRRPQVGARKAATARPLHTVKQANQMREGVILPKRGERVPMVNGQPVSWDHAAELLKKDRRFSR